LASRRSDEEVTCEGVGAWFYSENGCLRNFDPVLIGERLGRDDD